MTKVSKKYNKPTFVILIVLVVVFMLILFGLYRDSVGQKCFVLGGNITTSCAGETVAIPLLVLLFVAVFVGGFMLINHIYKSFQKVKTKTSKKK